mmetsp:Transcript_4839/g.5967  ORF Transcript_4839/g.5967 Transcript_4839/m.5967 type:complete len:434 (-) Transcript_4839:13-1314(-)
MDYAKIAENLHGYFSLVEYHCRAATEGNAKLFRFYFNHALDWLRLPEELSNTNYMKARLKKREKFKLTVPAEYQKQYMLEYKELQKEIAGLMNDPKNQSMEFRTKQYFFFAVRILTCIASFYGDYSMVVLLSLLQFVFLPFSIFISLVYGVETIFVLYSGYVLFYPGFCYLCKVMLHESLQFSFTISYEHLALFLLVDQLLCTICLFYSPKGRTATPSRKRILQSVVYGFLNTKTYYIVLFPMMVGLEVPLTPWILDACFGVTGKLMQFLFGYWEVLFYPVHHIGHMRDVYKDAHKFHHFLHDSTAFDAHVFGTGAPEEWLLLMADIACGRFLSLQPGSLHYHTLGISWLNKYAFHTRQDDRPKFHSDNFHADHHARHTVNMGMDYPYDLLMKTVAKELMNKVTVDGYNIERIEKNDTIELIFSPISEKTKST